MLSRLIREHLQAMDLDWDLPPLAVESAADPVPSTITVEGSVPDPSARQSEAGPTPAVRELPENVFGSDQP